MITALLSCSTAAAVLTESRKIRPDDGQAGDEFGYSVALAEGMIGVGARLDDDNGMNSGSAYLIDAVTGMQRFKLVPTDGSAGDEFGSSISIGSGTVAVGAVLADGNGTGSGAAYVFDLATGTQIATLIPNDGAEGDEFGCAVAVADGIVAVGAKRDDDNGLDSGAVYLFDVSTGGQLAKILPNDGAASATFGESVALDSGILAVGAHGDSENGFLSGAVYLFDLATTTQTHKLLPTNGAANNFFGSAVAIGSGIVAAGAWARSVVFDHSGAAYVFSATTGSEVVGLLPEDGGDRDHFGVSIAVGHGMVAVGANGHDDTAFNAGAAYLFDPESGIQSEMMIASDGAPFDEFGGSIAVGGGLVVVGAAGDDDLGDSSGSLYVFDVSRPLFFDGMEAGTTSAWSSTIGSGP